MGSLTDIEADEADSQTLLSQSPARGKRTPLLSIQLQVTGAKSAIEMHGPLRIAFIVIFAFLFLFPWTLSLFMWLRPPQPASLSPDIVSVSSPALLSFASSPAPVVLPWEPSSGITKSRHLVPDAQSGSVSALHSIDRDEEIGCGVGRMLSVLDCRTTGATGFDWASGRVRGGILSCAAHMQHSCDGKRSCTVPVRDAWTTFRCLNATEPLPPPVDPTTLAASTPVPTAPLTGRTLVIYVYSNSTPHAFHNLVYFIENAIRPTHTADYVIIVNSDDDETKHNRTMRLFPALPANARFLHHKNECYDWGTLGWILSMQRKNVTSRDDPHYIDTTIYSWFVLINSSVRGPFLARWQDQSSPLPQLWWLYPFQEMLLHDPAVRLSGSTISLRFQAHVQSYVWVTDRIGFNLLQSERSIMGCHTYWEAVFIGEIASSRLMLTQGYNLACLSRVYRDADFRAYAAKSVLYPPQFESIDPMRHGMPAISWRSQIPGDGKRVHLDHWEQLFIKQKLAPANVAIAALQDYEQAEYYSRNNITHPALRTVDTQSSSSSSSTATAISSTASQAVPQPPASTASPAVQAPPSSTASPAVQPPPSSSARPAVQAPRRPASRSLKPPRVVSTEAEEQGSAAQLDSDSD